MQPTVKTKTSLEPSSDSARAAVKLDQVILAEFEQERRRRSTPDQRGASYVRLLLALIVECDRPALLTALSASIANALANPAKPHVMPDLLLRFYPRESSTLHLATHRIRRLFTESSVRLPLDRFHSSIALAKSTSLHTVIEGSSDDANGTWSSEDLVSYWRQAAVASRELLTVMMRELHSHDFADPAPVKAPLLALLDETIVGGHSAVGADGSVSIPAWAERRQSERIRVGKPGILIWHGVRKPITISDVSATGVGLEGVGMVVPGDALTVELGDGLRFHGVVAWSVNHKAGLALKQSPQTDDPFLSFISKAG